MMNANRHTLPMTRALAALAATAILSASQVFAFSFQPPADRTGAPPGGMTCAACHTGSGSGNVNLSFGDGSLTYVPGETYSLEVMIQDTGQDRFGFSMVSRDENAPTVDVGTWTAGNDSGVYDSGRHIGHQSAPFASDSYTFTVSWTAPAGDPGPVRFYAVANAANGNRSSGPGDNIYTTQLLVEPAQPDLPFWSDSVIVDGWRNSGEAYPGLVGIGWIHDAEWPWIYTFSHRGSDGDWIYVFTDTGDQSSFYGYNSDGGYYFWGNATVGWYYSFKQGEEGWYRYNF